MENSAHAADHHGIPTCDICVNVQRVSALLRGLDAAHGDNAADRDADNKGRAELIPFTPKRHWWFIVFYPSRRSTSPASLRVAVRAYAGSMTLTPIVEASLCDVPAIQALERAAGQPFRDLGMGAIADDEPMSKDELRLYIDDRRAWIIRTEAEPSAYCLVDRVDGAAHIEQVSVHPRSRGRRLGKRLIEHAIAWARSAALTGVTLTTFREVPWNGPYYESLGFRWIAEPALGPQLRAIRAHERAIGLDRWPRGAMRLGPDTDGD